MAAPMIHQHHLQGVLIRVRKLIEEDSRINGIQLRKLQKKALAGRGFNCAIHIKVLETALYCSDGFDNPPLLATLAAYATQTTRTSGARALSLTGLPSST